MIGPGKYDTIATLARKRAHASGVILIIIDGKLGHGLEVQIEELDLLYGLPAILRQTADGIEAELKTGAAFAPGPRPS